MAFVGTVMWKAVDSGKRDRVGETAELEGPGCALLGSPHPWRESPHLAAPDKGQMSFLFSLQVPSDVCELDLFHLLWMSHWRDPQCRDTRTPEQSSLMSIIGAKMSHI